MPTSTTKITELTRTDIVDALFLDKEPFHGKLSRPFPYHRSSLLSNSENLMNQHVPGRFAFISILMLSAVSFAQQPAPAPETPKDTIKAIPGLL